MKKALLVLLVLISLVAIIYADPENNGNNSNNNINISCIEDEDCHENYECEDNLCVLNDEDNNETDNEDNETNDEEKICCEIYGFGTNMTKVDIHYRWLDSNACKIPEGFVGGGREVVNDSYCSNLTKDEKKEAIRERNRIRFEGRTGQECLDDCICTGVVMKCILEDGTREMTVYARSGNIIFQVKGTNATTTVILYHYNGKTYGNFSDGTKEIKIFPDKVKEKIKEKKKISIEQENMELDGDGIYKVEAKKKARFFFIFLVREKFYTEVDSENGEILKFRNPWWGFLAKDIKE